ncbi:MAG: ABC transporter substrate-binding protein [Desulfobacteraceae bacterium]|nr:ABC transporter substrate-binding protein [Desulfobacteraceae bacterium]
MGRINKKVVCFLFCHYQIVLSLFIILVVLNIPKYAYSESIPINFVQSISDDLISVVKSENKIEKKIQEIKKIVVGKIHKKVAILLIGRNVWEIMSAEQQNEYRNALDNYLAAMLFSAIRDSHVESFETVDSQEIDKNIVYVSGTLHRTVSNKLSKRMVVKLKEIGEDLHIIDIKIEEMSVVIGRRSEIANVLRKKKGDVSKLIEFLVDLAKEIQKESP